MKKIMFNATFLIIYILNIMIYSNAMETSTVSIVLSTDDNYIEPALVTITSILENSKYNTLYDFYILVPHNLATEHQKKFDTLKSKYTKSDFNFIEVNDCFKNTKVRSSSHITMAAYYRLLLPSLLPNLNKVLYLDVDLIVLTDLSQLFKINIDNYYVAGVRGYNNVWMNNYAKRKAFESYEQILKIPSMNQYINSGVMLMNLKLMRDDNLQEKFINFVSKYHGENRVGLCHDQDVINSICYNKIYFLPLRYNVMQHYVGKYDKLKSLSKI